jgi:peptidoglycan/LPS O-acetylase OafA/YrhL
MGPRYWAPDGVTTTDVALTALFANGWSPSAINSIIPGGWSVAIETTFYLLLPLCFLWVRSLGSAVLVTVVALIARYELCAWQMRTLQPHFTESQQYLPLAFSWELWLPAQLPVFMLGIVLFFVRERVQNKQLGLASCLLVGSVVLIAASHDVFPDRFISNAFLAGIGFVLMALALIDNEVPFLNNALLRKVGEVSFSIYLLHHLVMHFGAQYVIKVLNVLNLGTSGDLSYAIAFAIIASASTLVSMLTFRFVEQPSINLGAKLAQKIDTTRRSAVTGQTEPAN